MRIRRTRRELLALLGPLFWAGCDSAPAQPVQSVEVLVGLDLTGSLAGKKGYHGKTEFDRGLAALEKLPDRFPADSQLTITTITQDSLNQPWPLLSEASPSGRRRYQYSKDPLKSWRRRIKTAIKKLRLLKPEYGETNLFGFLVYAGDFFGGSGQKRKALILVSDMRASMYLNLERETAIDVEKDLQEAKDRGLMANLEGVEVYCLWLHGGLKGEDVPPLYWNSLREFWEAYFEQCGATVKKFSMAWDVKEVFR